MKEGMPYPRVRGGRIRGDEGGAWEQAAHARGATMASPMISRKELERLAALRSDEGVLSVYLKIDPRLRDDPNQAAAKFKGALKRFQRTTAGENLASVAEREKDR